MKTYNKALAWAGKNYTKYRSKGRALRDDTKNGRGGDYICMMKMFSRGKGDGFQPQLQ